MALGMGVIALVVFLTSGFSMLPFVLALLLDQVLILLVLLYVLLRMFLPFYANPSFADGFMLNQFLFIVIPGVLAVRIATMWVAHILGATRSRTSCELSGYRISALARLKSVKRCRKT